MKTQVFFRGMKVDFYLERYERTPDLSSFEKVPDLVNFERLPPNLKTTEPRADWMKKNGAVVCLEGKRKKDDWITGLRPTLHGCFYEGNDKDKSEVRAYFTNQNRTLWVAYFRGFRVFTYEKSLFNDSVIEVVRRLTANQK